MIRYFYFSLITLIAMPNKVPCSVVVEVSLDGFIYEGKEHCDNIFGLYKCDPYFVVCVSTRNKSCNSNMVRTSTARNKNELKDIVEMKQISPDPISFKIDSFKEVPFVVRIEVINNNPIHDKLIDVVSWVCNETTTFNETGVKLTGRNRQARLTVSFLIKCDTNYYGPSCDLFCTPDDHSRCDKNGIKRCLPGFTDRDCNISIESATRTPERTEITADQFQYNTKSTDTSHLTNQRSVATRPRSARSANTVLINSTSQTTKVSNYTAPDNQPTVIPSASSIETFSSSARETIVKLDQTNPVTSYTFQNITPTMIPSPFTTKEETKENDSLSTDAITVFFTKDQGYTDPTSSRPSSIEKGKTMAFSTISSQTSEKSSVLPPTKSLDTNSSDTIERFSSVIPTKLTSNKTPMQTPTPKTSSSISTVFSSKVTRLSTTASLKSSTKKAEPSTQIYLSTTQMLINSTVIQQANESILNPIGYAHERSGQTDVPKETQSWIMPLAITLTLVAVIMSITAAVIFIYFKKRQRSGSYIEMIDNEAEVEIFNGGSLHLQLEPQTTDHSTETSDVTSDDTPQNEP